jgi:hypothetical protein
MYKIQFVAPYSTGVSTAQTWVLCKSKTSEPGLAQQSANFLISVLPLAELGSQRDNFVAVLFPLSARRVEDCGQNGAHNQNHKNGFEGECSVHFILQSSQICLQDLN